jgi:lambda repressor-like predicted transcriptional regulator
MAQRPTERLNANIVAALDERGMSKTALADGVGVGRRTLYRRLEDAEGWTYTELLRAAQFIGVPVSRLVDGVEEMYAAEVAPTSERSA